MRHAVILAGGSGTRLWPASRSERPKQFLSFGGNGESLFAATVRRLSGVCPEGNLVVVTAASQRDLIRRAAPELPADAILAEPAARNTAAAIGLAAVHLVHRDPDAVIGVIPSDHHIGDETRYRKVVLAAFAAAEHTDSIVTIGVVPTRPETGFGYLELAATPEGDAAEPVLRFVEKPDRDTARRYLESGRHLWNAGMFFVKATRLLGEIARHLPDTHAGLTAIADALGRSRDDADRVTERVYPDLPAISIDHGVMERTGDVVTVRGDFAWSDVGSWAALAEFRSAGEDGNVVSGTVVTHDASGNIVVGDPNVAIAVVGVTDLVVVQSADGVLVVPKSRAQDVRSAVAALKERNLHHYL